MVPSDIDTGTVFIGGGSANIVGDGGSAGIEKDYGFADGGTVV